jgi:D-sedoheptulose 7-phosphate isomerase
MDLQSFIKQEFTEAQSVLESFTIDPNNFILIEKAADMMVEAILKGKKIISCGNGGSHCDAMHFAEELSGKYRNPRPALPAMAISDASHISCVANDFGYDFIFSRFIEALGQDGDVLMGLTTSGNSQNVLKAFEVAKQKNIKTIALTGKDGGKIAAIADIEIRVPYFGYADRIQEIHIKIIHTLMGLIERKLGYD